MGTYNIGYGSAFSYGTDGVTYGTTLANLVDITPPGIEVKDVETSNMGMADRWKRYMSGLGDGGEVEIQMIFNKAQQAVVMGLLFINDLYFKITLSDINITASVWLFQGYLKGVKGAVPLEDRIMATFTFKVSGPVTFTAGT